MEAKTLVLSVWDLDEVPEARNVDGVVVLWWEEVAGIWWVRGPLVWERPRIS